MYLLQFLSRYPYNFRGLKLIKCVLVATSIKIIKGYYYYLMYPPKLSKFYYILSILTKQEKRTTATPLHSYPCETVTAVSQLGTWRVLHAYFFL